MRLLERLKRHAPRREAPAFLRYLGPGLLVTVGFIDPGNWASNIAAGSQFGYQLLWIVTLSTVMLILLQHNAAHLGIASGLCLSEAATRHLSPAAAKIALGSASVAAVSTALAEILGAAIGGAAQKHGNGKTDGRCGNQEDQSHGHRDPVPADIGP